jgi:hypothetical protein
MLFVAEYEVRWESLEAVVARRLEWDAVRPDDFRFVGEYVWQDRDPPFRGVAIIEADSVDAVNSFVLHYGPTLRVQVHPATDVVHGIGLLRDGGAVATQRSRSAKRRTRPKRRHSRA